MIYAQTVQRIEMPFAPYDRAMHNGRAVLFAVAEIHVTTPHHILNGVHPRQRMVFLSTVIPDSHYTLADSSDNNDAYLPDSVSTSISVSHYLSIPVYI